MEPTPEPPAYDTSTDCGKYLACSAEAAPDTLDDAERAYGASGVCFAAMDEDACQLACRRALYALHELHGDVAACGICQEDSECTTAAPACVAGSCVECATSSDCDDRDHPACDTKQHECVQCASDDNCTDSSQPRCATSHSELLVQSASPRHSRCTSPAYRPATRVRYHGLLGQGVLAHFGTMQLERIDALAMRAYDATLKARGIKSKGPMNFIRTVLRAAVEAGALAALPSLPSFAEKDEKLPETYDESEVEQLLGSDSQPWLKLAISLAAFAGCRLGEVLAMEVQDVDLAGGWFTIRRALSEREVVTPKNNKARVVPIAPQLVPHLQLAIRSKMPRARLVLNSNGATPTRQAVLNALKHVARKLQLPTRSFHSLRHFFCSTLIRHGGSVEAVRMLAGHSKMAMTARYVHATSSDLQAAIAKLGSAR